MDVTLLSLSIKVFEFEKRRKEKEKHERKKEEKKKKKKKQTETRAILQHALSLLPSRRTLAYATRPTTGLDTFSDVTR